VGVGSALPGRIVEGWEFTTKSAENTKKEGYPKKLEALNVAVAMG
jgi:hypothetical protein